MISDGKSFEERLEEMRAEYASTLKDKLIEVQRTFNLVASHSTLDGVAVALADLRNQAHVLAGTAGSFGFSDIGKVSKKIELQCQRLIEKGGMPTKADIEEANLLVIALLELGSNPCDGVKIN